MFFVFVLGESVTKLSLVDIFIHVISSSSREETQANMFLYSSGLGCLEPLHLSRLVVCLASVVLSCAPHNVKQNRFSPDHYRASTRILRT